MWQQENLLGGGLLNLSIALFTRVLGWTSAEVETFLIDVRKEIKDTKIHAYWPM